jgi:hypothetical protein
MAGLCKRLPAPVPRVSPGHVAANRIEQAPLTLQGQLVVWVPCSSQRMASRPEVLKMVAVCIDPHSCLGRSRGRRDRTSCNNILSRSGNGRAASQISLDTVSVRGLRNSLESKPSCIECQESRSGVEV